MKQQSFDWERPPAMDPPTLHAAACVEQARVMKETLMERDCQIRLLHKQLSRMNEQNYRLVQELEG